MLQVDVNLNLDAILWRTVGGLVGWWRERKLQKQRQQE